MNRIKYFITFALSICIAMLTGCTDLLNDNYTSDTVNKSQLIVHYIDVEQGDSIFIELPNSKTMLIDAGEKEYGNTVIDYVKKAGYNKIDYIVATHPHSDHIGGMEAVIKAFDFDKFYMPDYAHTSSTYKNMLTALSIKNKKATKAIAGISIYNSDDLSIKIVAPVKDSYSSINDYSVVIRIQYKEKSFLFAGDIEETAEKDITENISADVLKVAHHGSSSSSGDDFLSKVNPLYAVISVGKDNDYGHPHKEILQKLKQREIQILRTDEKGTIVISSDGDNIKINGSISDNSISKSSSDEPQGKYILNTSSKKIHTSDCPYAKDISPQNRETTDDIEKALASGYTACKSCNPK